MLRFPPSPSRTIAARPHAVAPRAQGGVTLVELSMTIVILVVLSMIALPSFQRLLASQKVANGASDVFIALVKARSEAIKRNSNVVITSVSDSTDWSAGWTSTDQASGAVLDRHGSLGTITATGPTSIVYQGSGRIQAAVVPFSLSSSIANVTPRCITLNLTGRPSVQAAAC